MSSYVRPLIEAPVFRDADGAVINYGSRWHGSPPEDTYSVDTHPERFAPLHVVADALIAHLRETYDVEVDEGVEVAADLLRPAFHDVVRAVRIRPNDPKCASLTLVFTAYPRSTDRLRTGAAASSSDVRRGGLRRCLDEGVTIWRTLLSVMFRVPPRWRSVGAAGVVRPRLVRAGR